MTARLEQYSIPLSVYIDKEDFQPVADDGMLIRNHNFNRSVELVSADSWHVTTSLEAEAEITRLEVEFARLADVAFAGARGVQT